MRRPYTLDHYRRLVDGIVERLPHASIGSDMIVGFPGETDDDFEVNAGTCRRRRFHICMSSRTRIGRAPRLRRCRQGAGPGDPRSRDAGCARSARQLTRAFPGSAGGHRPARPDARGRDARRHRQLSEGEIPPGRPRNERVQVRLTGKGRDVVGRSLRRRTKAPSRRASQTRPGSSARQNPIRRSSSPSPGACPAPCRASTR